MDHEKEIDDIIQLLDQAIVSEKSRIKVNVSEKLKEGEVKKEYHHGRCDINSPWACGTAFDVIE